MFAIPQMRNCSNSCREVAADVAMAAEVAVTAAATAVAVAATAVEVVAVNRVVTSRKNINKGVPL